MSEIPEDPAALKARIAARFIEALPHARHLGMQVIETGEGWVLMALDYDLRFVGDPETGVLHGGVVTALLDTSCGASVIAHAQAPDATATIDLRIDYMRPAQPGRRLYARAECYRITRTVAFEVKPMPGESPQIVIANAKRTLRAAWRQV